MYVKEKTEIVTEKLYYGFPVVLLGYKDDKFKYNATTISSSYSLRDTLTIGVKSVSHAASHIKKHKEFTLNVPSDKLLGEVEVCGFFSGHNKLQQADLTYEIAKTVDAPVIDDCFLTIECKVVHHYDHNGYTHFVADVTNRLVDKNLIAEDGTFKAEEIDTIHFIGCSKERHYRFLKEETATKGDFVYTVDNCCG
ncbi:MAG: flavin reductase family protein [Gemella sp.]|nr:flavin reductase family protein [Gemella sp.]